MCRRRRVCLLLSSGRWSSGAAPVAAAAAAGDCLGPARIWPRSTVPADSLVMVRALVWARWLRLRGEKRRQLDSEKRRLKRRHGHFKCSPFWLVSNRLRPGPYFTSQWSQIVLHHISLSWPTLASCPCQCQWHLRPLPPAVYRQHTFAALVWVCIQLFYNSSTHFPFRICPCVRACVGECLFFFFFFKYSSVPCVSLCVCVCVCVCKRYFSSIVSIGQ